VFLRRCGFSPTASAQPQILWSPAGPPGDPDRILALAVDPRNDSVLYLAAPGGAWKTQDGGASWIPQFDSAPSSQVCSLALDPRFPDVVYLGTGTIKFFARCKVLGARRWRTELDLAGALHESAGLRTRRRSGGLGASLRGLR